MCFEPKVTNSAHSFRGFLLSGSSTSDPNGFHTAPYTCGNESPFPPFPMVISPGEVPSSISGASAGGSSPKPPIAASAFFQSNTCTLWSTSPVMTTRRVPHCENARPITDGMFGNGSCATMPRNDPSVFTRESQMHTIGGPLVDATCPVAKKCMFGCIAMHLMSSSWPWKKCCV